VAVFRVSGRQLIKELLQDQTEASVSDELMQSSGCTHRRSRVDRRNERHRRRFVHLGALGLALVLCFTAGLLAWELWYLVQNPAEFPLSTYTTYALQNLRFVLVILIIGPIVFMGMVWRIVAQDRTKAEALVKARKKRDDMRVSFHQLRHVFASLPVPYVLAHMDGRLIQGNVEALDAFGLDPDDLSKYSLNDLIVDQNCQQNIEKAMQTHQRCSGCIISSKNRIGHRRWYMIAASRVEVNQRPLMFVTFTDITAQKQAERAVQKNEAALRGIIEASPLPTVIFDPASNYVAFVNNAALAFFKNGSDAQVGMTASDLWETQEQYQALVNEMRALGSLHDQEMRLKGKGDDVQWVLGSLTTVMHRKREMVCCAFTDITARKLKEIELMKLATTDPLTGTLNRRAFQDHCQKEYARAQRGAYTLSVISCDLDHFKKINDDFGHATGDEVLRKFTQVVQDSLRPGDVFGRIGGEEFAILLPGADTEIAMMIAERIQNRLFDMPILAPNGDRLSATASFGIAEWQNMLSLEAVLSNADDALYMAKRNGRNCIQVSKVYDKEIPAISAE